MRAGEGIIVLIADANRCIQTLSQGCNIVKRIGQDNASAIQDDGEFRIGDQFSRFRNRAVTTLWALECNDFWQLNINNLRPHITRNVDLCWRGGPMCLHNHSVEDFSHSARVAHFFLVGNHIFEQFHLLNFLEATLTDCFVGSLRCDQKQRCMVPIGSFDRGDEIGDTRTVLRDHHGHFAGGAGVAIRHHASRPFMGTVPKHNSSFWKNIRNRHHGRTNDPKSVADTVHLKRFYKGFFCGHFHGSAP